MRGFRYILTLSLMMAVSSHCQEVRIGMIVGTGLFERMTVTDAQYSPQNSYYTYVEDQVGVGIIDSRKVFNSAHIGGVINLSYRRFSLVFEPQFFYNRSAYAFTKPEQLKRVLVGKGFRMPMYLTYKFFKKETSSYFILGMIFNREDHFDFQHPGEDYYFGEEAAFVNSPNYGYDHFNGLLYDNSAYGSGLIGIGKQFEKLNMSLRLSRPFANYRKRLSFDSWRLELTASWLFLSTKDFTRKHPLYVD